MKIALKKGHIIVEVHPIYLNYDPIIKHIGNFNIRILSTKSNRYYRRYIDKISFRKYLKTSFE